MRTRGCASGWPSAVEKALRADAEPPLPASGTNAEPRARLRSRAAVLVSDKASSRTTVVEVNARDRPGLLARLAHVIHSAGHQLHSAHIATYGERAVDVFYLTRPTGGSCPTKRRQRCASRFWPQPDRKPEP